MSPSAIGRFCVLLTASAVAFAAVLPIRPAVAIGEPPPCPQATVTLLRDISTAHARTGDPFEVETVERAYGPNGVVIPEASRGGGVIALVQHANRGGKGGQLVLEMRFVSGPHGEHIPATIDWLQAEHALANGDSRNAPGIANLIPFANYLLTPYAYLHHGTDVTVPRATRLLVVLGDGVADGTCRMTPPPPDGPALPVPPPPTPEPAATPTPSPMPSASEDWTQLPTFAATPTPAPEESPEPEPTDTP